MCLLKYEIKSFNADLSIVSNIPNTTAYVRAAASY